MSGDTQAQPAVDSTPLTDCAQCQQHIDNDPDLLTVAHSLALVSGVDIATMLRRYLIVPHFNGRHRDNNTKGLRG